ncbi:hypothetical protein OAI24_03075 [Alphaproteobacteria bacterium]|nr:hypothetical protein [Alphaproteobacteria bacterium]
MLIRRRLIQANLLGALFLIGWILLYQLLLADDVTLKAVANSEAWLDGLAPEIPLELGGGISIVFICAYLLSFWFLYFEKTMGRSLFTVTVFLAVFSNLFFGYIVSDPYTAFMLEISVMLEGALLFHIWFDGDIKKDKH